MIVGDSPELESSSEKLDENLAAMKLLETKAIFSDKASSLL